MSTHYTEDGIFIKQEHGEVFLDGFAIVEEWLSQASAPLTDRARAVLDAPRKTYGSIHDVAEATATLIETCERVA